MNVKKKVEPDCVVKVAGIEVRIPGPIEVSQTLAEKLPGEILRFGQLLASAEEQKIMIDAEYRQWRATYAIELLKQDRKISEWRTKAKLESEPGFLHFKTGQALAEKHVLILRAVVDSLQARLELCPTV